MTTRLYVTKMVVRFQVVFREIRRHGIILREESKPKRKLFLSFFFFFGFAYYNREFSSIFRVCRERAVKREEETSGAHRGMKGHRTREMKLHVNKSTAR